LKAEQKNDNGKIWSELQFKRRELNARLQQFMTRNPAIAEGPRDAGVPVEIW